MAINSLHFIKSITVEPAIFLYTAVYVIMQQTFMNLLLQKKCRFNSTLEPNLDTNCDDEKNGVLFVTEVNSLTRLVMFLFCGVFGILAMSWSDIAGRRRRPLFLLPLIGLIFQALTGCLHSFYWHWAPLSAAWTTTLFEMISGSLVLITLVSQTYLCDVTDLETRTMRMGFLTASRTLGDLIGYGSAGYILHGVGFFYTFVLCFVLSLLTLVLGLIFVKDVSINVDKKLHVLQFFNLTRVVDSFRVVFNKNLANKRIIVSILCAIFALVYFTMQGEYSILYLFLRLKFHWKERDYSLYIVYRQIGIVVGSLFCSIVLSKILKMHDGLIGVFAGVWDTIAVIGYLLATQEWHIYLVPLFDIFHGTVLSVSISFFSKFYKDDEFGHLNSVLAVFGLAMPACFPAYNAIFQRTVDVFPSAYFLLSIVLDIGIVILYWATYKLSTKMIQPKSPTIKEEMTTNTLMYCTKDTLARA
ncbi:probable peptidoglycan muropeptide transporter SLC46 [Planococcus citri]|uniref:probable peptidoglycan muropeptide transporter SLC46 n=1 Tax=Planococcus citri TaxID=170843 RepID=UPI0031F98589